MLHAYLVVGLAPPNDTPLLMHIRPPKLPNRPDAMTRFIGQDQCYLESPTYPISNIKHHLVTLLRQDGTFGALFVRDI